MKKILLLSLLFVSITLTAQTVKLKITYKDFPVYDSDITIKIGDATIGTGRTNDEGEVSINCSNLIVKNIDVYGSKKSGNATKTWDVKGYVVLDGSNYFHLKMEVLAKEMAEASGGFMSENSIAAMWGLSASGKNDSPNNSSSSNNNSSNSSSDNTTSNNSSSNNASTAPEEKEEPIDLNQMREENMLAYKQNLEAEVLRYERKIKRDQKDIDEAKSEGKSQSEIRRLEIEKEIDVLTKEKKEIQLKETNAKISKTELPFEERKRNDARKDDIKSQISLLKEEAKKLKKESKESTNDKNDSDTKNNKNDSTENPNDKNNHNGGTEPKEPKEIKETKETKEVKSTNNKEEEYIGNPKYSDDAIKNKSKISLKMELADLKMDLKSKNFSLKTKSSMMAQDKLEYLKKEIAEIEVLIQKYENRLAELNVEKE